MPLSPEDAQECINSLRVSTALKYCKDEDLQKLSDAMEKKVYKHGDILSHEGQPQTQMFVIAKGSVRREKTALDGSVHHIDTHMGGSTVGTLHIMNQDPSYATSICNADDCVAYTLSSDKFNNMFKSNPRFAWDVAYSLTVEVRKHTRAQRTPLLEQHPKKTSVTAVSLAAGIESFYRAALNAVLNQRLTGVKMVSLFPNMHIQVPTRIVYINGFKGLRARLDSAVDPDTYANPTAVRLGLAVTPGILMTPVSSILEACNAGHSNPEPLYRRWTRGIVPRCGREVIFGVGLNQLSDFCEERVPFFENSAIRNAGGSLTAGVISGYLSHVVHNLSTLKLMNPNKSYGTHFKEYVAKAETRLPTNFQNPTLRRVGATALACIFPAGLLIRTSQIVGTFVILNGTINAITQWGPEWLRRF